MSSSTRSSSDARRAEIVEIDEILSKSSEDAANTTDTSWSNRQPTGVRKWRRGRPPGLSPNVHTSDSQSESDSLVSSSDDIPSFNRPLSRWPRNFDVLPGGKRRSKRLNAPTYSPKIKKAADYDGHGHLISDGRDVCDCLEDFCPGCHLPCPSCRSRKCGPECRVNRQGFYDFLEVEGTPIEVRNPYISELK